MHYLIKFLSRLIFLSRWLQAPLYLGLILALGIYVYEFAINLIHLVSNLVSLNETQIMLAVLDLIDVVMIANLLIMVIVGGYEVFVSHLNLHEHPDQPEWLEEVNAGTMKIKLALALVSISSIHLLRTFFDSSKMSREAIFWQVIIHLTLLLSAFVIAITNKYMAKGRVSKRSLISSNKNNSL